MKYWAVLLLSFNSLMAFSQNEPSKAYRHDFFLTVDNDAFLAQAVDRYYSSGIYFRFRKAVPLTTRLAKMGGKKLDKAIYSIGLTHIFFTPSDLKLRTIDQFDRPYAGLMALNFGVQYIRQMRTSIRLNIEAGVMGPAAGVQELQEWYHELIGAKTPRGWQFQIENTPLISVEIDYRRSLLKGARTELTAEGILQAGTVFNHIKPGLGFRWGKLQAATNSSFFGSRLRTVSKGAPKGDWKESFFFVKAYMGFVAYDASIEGNLIGEESLHTEDPQRLRYHFKYGWTHALNRWDFSLAFNNVRRETKESRDHYYVSIDLLYRF